MRQRTIGNALVSAGLLVMALGLVADGAGAHSDTGPNYKDKVTKIEGSRSYDSNANTTTFAFNATFSEQVSHLVVSSCPEGVNVVDATAPSGVKAEKNKTDPGGTDATGAKFEPGKSGTYTVTFTGNVTGAEFIVKNGNGHKHYSLGSGCAGTPVTTSSTAPGTPERSESSAPETSDTSAPETSDTTAPDTSDTTAPDTSDTSAPERSDSSAPGTSETTTPTTGGSPETTQPSTTATTGGSGNSTSTTDATVLGSQLVNPSNPGTGVGSDVLGGQQAQTPTLARTGGDVGGYLLLAGLALVLGGLAVRFGQAEPALS